VKSTAARHGLKAPPLMMALRMLVTGTPQTPAIDAVLSLVGRDATRERMRAGLSL
jgi:glutamyl-tRNA synthetase